MDSASSMVGGLWMFWVEKNMYQDTIAKITKNFEALLGFENSPFGEVILLEEEPADCFGTFWFDSQSFHI